MTPRFAPWDSAVRCVGSARPGARALMAFCLASDPLARNLGIYACRPVRGGSEPSKHAEGRADDVGFPMVNGRANPAGHRLVRRLLRNPERCGIQAIIFDRTIWSAKSPNGRPYRGVNPHLDHVHIELTRDAADRLNVATLRHWLADPVPKPVKTKVEQSIEVTPARKYYVVRPGDTLTAIAARCHTTVAALQRLNKINDPDLIRAGDKLKLPKEKP